MISSTFAQALEARRSDYNRRFAEARRSRPDLDGDTFFDLLRSTMDPIVNAVAQHDSQKTEEVVGVLYELSLDLLGQGLLGPESRYPYITAAWKELLPRLAPQIAAAPHLMVGSVANAMYNLSLVPNARPQEWIDSMSKLASICPDASLLLEAGKVAAWRAGLAHYRQGALDVCRKMDPTVARAALGLEPDAAPPLNTVLDRLSADPWLDPASVREQPSVRRDFKMVARVGAFRGFGGLFVAPPTVKRAGEYFHVNDGQSGWLLTADIFGATLHRSEEIAAAPVEGPFQIDAKGRVTDGRESAVFSELSNATSSASSGTTLAVTVPFSFSIYLIALVEQ